MHRSRTDSKNRLNVNFPCCWYLVYSRVLSMVHSAASWVYRALEFIRAYACVKTPLDVTVGTSFIHVSRMYLTGGPNPGAPTFSTLKWESCLHMVQALARGGQHETNFTVHNRIHTSWLAKPTLFGQTQSGNEATIHQPKLCFGSGPCSSKLNHDSHHFVMLL